jgi:hypothetical protein
MPLHQDITRLLIRELDAFQREIELFPNDDSLWRSVPGVTNPAGTLALHVAGNLQHFVGAVLGGSGYIRNREAEFGTRGRTRTEVVAELQRARSAVAGALAHLDPCVLAQPYPAAPGGVTPRTELFLLHLVAHAAFHLGQAGYLRRIVTGDPTSANPIPVAALTDPVP